MFGDRNFSDYAGPEPDPEVVPVGAGHIERMGTAASERSLTVDGNKLTVIGRGPMLFEALMAQGGLYARLAELQFRAD